jgi:hypothetical protein
MLLHSFKDSQHLTTCMQRMEVTMRYKVHMRWHTGAQRCEQSPRFLQPVPAAVQTLLQHSGLSLGQQLTGFLQHPTSTCALIKHSIMNIAHLIYIMYITAKRCSNRYGVEHKHSASMFHRGASVLCLELQRSLQLCMCTYAT